MRRRATRPNVFRELTRFGVFPGDWKYILIPTAAAYFLPFFYGIWIYYIPAGLPLGLTTFVILLAVYNFLRKAKPRGWLKNRFAAALDGWRPFQAPLGEEMNPAEWTSPGGKK